MLRTSRRPPTSAELKKWHERFDPTFKRRLEAGLLYFLPTVGGYGFGVLFLPFWHGGPKLAPWPCLVFGGVGLLISITLIVLTLIYRDPPPKPPAEVEEVEVQAIEVLEREPFGDEGPIYFFQVEPDTMVLLFGNWMWTTQAFGGLEDEEEERFPSSQFRVIHDPRSGVVFELEAMGTVLRPVLKVDDEFRDYVLLPEVCVLKGTLGKYEAAVRREAGSEGKWRGKLPKKRIGQG